VVMASYAPLLAHAEAWQWTPNLIWCDNLRVYGTPSYYVQQLFSRHRGDFVVPVQVGGAGRLFASASKEAKTGQFILKVVNPGGQRAPARIRLSGLGRAPRRAEAIVLSGVSPADVNSFDNPTKVAPVSSQFKGIAADFDYTFSPYSLTVLRMAP